MWTNAGSETRIVSGKRRNFESWILNLECIKFVRSWGCAGVWVAGIAVFPMGGGLAEARKNRERNPLRGRNPPKVDDIPADGGDDILTLFGLGKATLISAAGAAAELVVEDAAAVSSLVAVGTVAGVAAVAEVAALFAVAAEVGVSTSGVGGATAFALAGADFAFVGGVASGFGAALVFAHVYFVAANFAGAEALDELRGNLGRDLDEGMLEEETDIAHGALGGAAFVVEQAGDVLGAQAEELAAVHEESDTLLQAAPVVALLHGGCGICCCRLGIAGELAGAILGDGLNLAAGLGDKQVEHAGEQLLCGHVDVLQGLGQLGDGSSGLEDFIHQGFAAHFLHLGGGHDLFALHAHAHKALQTGKE